ncbi:MAG: hypothetical protein ACOVLB_01940 [Candidatus Nanopelagicus sp.]
MPIQKGPANLGTGVIETAELATNLVVTHALGSASTPSITFTGDTNTGIFSPTADTIAFAEGGAEVARFDSNGNLGIGTASPAAKTEISGTAAAQNLALRITNTATDGYSTLQLGGGGDGGVFRNGSAQSGYGGASSLNLITVGAHNIGFATGNTIRAIIPAAGGVQAVTCVSVGNATPATSGAGITFPASQSASSDANTLDDYEEGTWTPNQGGGLTVSGTYSSSGRYVKIGRLVYVEGSQTGTSNIAVSSVGALCTNLPFQAIAGITSGFGGLTNNSINQSNTTWVQAGNTGLYATAAVGATAQLWWSATYYAPS